MQMFVRRSLRVIWLLASCTRDRWQGGTFELGRTTFLSWAWYESRDNTRVEIIVDTECDRNVGIFRGNRENLCDMHLK
jgi:hypothetical protein